MAVFPINHPIISPNRIPEVRTADTSTDQAASELSRSSIPAQVFLNYFYALYRRIEHSANAYDLSSLPYFAHFAPEVGEKRQASVRRHLLNSWNTEYTLRTTAQADHEYLRHTLHWTFPQAYYSVQESLLAMLRTQGVSTRRPERILAEGSKRVVRGAYPYAVSFYVSGSPHRPRLRRLPHGQENPRLSLPANEQEVQQQIGQFLRTTHRQRANQLRQEIQASERALRTQKGEVLQRFEEKHWKQLQARIGYTSVFDLLGRLQIMPGHREIERFVQADIDVVLFHQSLLGIVAYFNFVHEAYVLKAWGDDAYQQWLEELPQYLRDSFISDRRERLTQQADMAT